MIGHNEGGGKMAMQAADLMHWELLRHREQELRRAAERAWELGPPRRRSAKRRAES